jgi:hypothetical protein
LEDLWGEDSSLSQEGLFVAGPFRVMGRPELVRLDLQGADPTLEAHVLCSGYDLNDVLVDTCDFYLDLSSTSGGTVVYPSVVETDHVDFSVRFYLKDTPTSMLSRFLLQVTNRV